MDKWLAHPTALKILSVIVALLLWAVVHFDPETNPKTNISTTITHVIDTVQIKTIGLDEKTRALRSIDPGAVKLVVSGTRTRLAAAGPDDYVVSANLSAVPNGRSEVTLSVELPKGVELIEMTPNRATVQIEPMQTKEFQVQVITEGEPANGYKAGEPIVKPNNRVHVTLPEDELELIGAVAVKVSVQNEEKTVTEKKARVVVYDNDGNELKDAVVSPSVVEVEVPITKPYKQLPLQIGYTGKLPDGLSIAKLTLSTEQVTVYGPQNVLDKLDFYDGVNVDLSKVTGSGTYTYDITPIEGIAAVDPAKVSVSVEIEPTESRVIPQVPIVLNGLAEGMSASLVIPAEGKMDISVRGAPSLLATIDEDDIQAVARLESLGVGHHEIVLTIHVPNYTSVDPLPYKVTVDITDSKSEDAAPVSNTGTSTGHAGAETGSSDAAQDEGEAASSGDDKNAAGTEDRAEPVSGSGSEAHSNQETDAVDEPAAGNDKHLEPVAVE
ncbi:CdaR family protein [Paenibacillus xylaniclasticus]|uniref:CdaR family protein n=1 Tax=Paenibacillus xylaniclasticus TaxID=588083 RepID=UPI0013DFECFD|nr:MULTISPECIES: CdaR family protein [Paenibacillus]GFN33192.1 CdaA regulatory protein CdaR [Paenibacillus curdlanolyticus]